MIMQTLLIFHFQNQPTCKTYRIFAYGYKTEYNSPNSYAIKVQLAEFEK